MNKLIVFVVHLFCAGSFLGLYGQSQPGGAARMEDGKLILRVEFGWSEEQKNQWAIRYDIDSLLVNALFSKNFDWIDQNSEWTVLNRDSVSAEIFKELGQPAHLRLDQILLSSSAEIYRPVSPEALFASYGRNDFTEEGGFFYDDFRERGCFVLAGYEQAQRVFLAGSFNQWNTMEIAMQPVENGWAACVQLMPGKHLYKFIVDGRWMHDPSNRIRERDGMRGFNSVVFAHNHIFRLSGFSGAQSVYVSGSFNGWNAREIAMIRTEEGWELPMYLRQGVHYYKFVVDGEWIPDPEQTNTSPDGQGGYNSMLVIGEPAWFELDCFEDATSVVLTGSFNDWNRTELQMNTTANGWIIPYVLAPGNYEYKFIVDGQWTTDPGNPFVLGFGDFTNSFLAHEPNHLFVLAGFEDAQNVVVTGSFNGWNRREYRMVFREGEWVFPIRLQQGRHSYRFVVDGHWMIDPENTLVERNEFNDFNSVIWIR